MKNKKYIPYAEIPVVENCNLNCNLCNSHAYLINQSQYPYIKFMQDVDTLSKYIHFGVVTFLGGEPLLCKELDNYIRYAKKKKIGEVYRILTNGILIKSISEEVMK